MQAADIAGLGPRQTAADEPGHLVKEPPQRVPGQRVVAVAAQCRLELAPDFRQLRRGCRDALHLAVANQHRAVPEVACGAARVLGQQLARLGLGLPEPVHLRPDADGIVTPLDTVAYAHLAVCISVLQRPSGKVEAMTTGIQVRIST